MTTDGIYEIQGVSVQNAPSTDTDLWKILQVYFMNGGTNGYQILSDTNQDATFYRTWNNSETFCNWLSLNAVSEITVTPIIVCAG